MTTISTVLQIPGIIAVNELHIWRLSQQKVLASVHVAITDHSTSELTLTATIKTVHQCCHMWGIDSVTVQPEVATLTKTVTHNQAEVNDLEVQEKYPHKCQSKCSSYCKELVRCG
jgi:zinc transporter 1